jgi:hypothetical protein
MKMHPVTTVATPDKTSTQVVMTSLLQLELSLVTRFISLLSHPVVLCPSTRSPTGPPKSIIHMMTMILSLQAKKRPRLLDVIAVTV